MERLGKIGYSFIHDAMFRNLLILKIEIASAVMMMLITFLGAVFVQSFYMGVMAAYYLILIQISYALTRGSRYSEQVQWRYYRFSSYVLLLTTPVIMLINGIILSENYTITYPGHMIYAVALFTTISVTSSIVGFFSGRGLVTPVILAKKNCGVVEAGISLILLQSSMITTFGGDTEFHVLMSGLTGMVVFAMIVLLSAYMIRVGNRNIRR